MRALGYKEGVQEDGGSLGRSRDPLTERSVGHPGAGDPSSRQSHFPAAPRGSELGSKPGAPSRRTVEEAGRGIRSLGLVTAPPASDARRAGPFVTSQSAV